MSTREVVRVAVNGCIRFTREVVCVVVVYCIVDHCSFMSTRRVVPVIATITKSYVSSCASSISAICMTDQNKLTNNK